MLLNKDSTKTYSLAHEDSVHIYYECYCQSEQNNIFISVISTVNFDTADNLILRLAIKYARVVRLLAN